MKYSNVFYIAHFNVIGGIETYMYELVKKYKNEDIVVVYSAESSDRKQLNRIRKYAKVIKLSKGEIIKCKRLFIMYKSDLSNFEADDVIQIIHADYKKQKLLPNHDERITQRFGVSKAVAKAYEELSGLKTEVCYNPLTIEKPKRVLKLISATRLTKEKGLDRMKKLAEELDKKEIPYLWLVFTNQTDLMNNPNVAYMKPRLDIRNYIADADYLVQLSDTEAWAYSVAESLCLNTPVIVTPIPCFEEMGIKYGVNGYILPFDMKNIPVEDIYNNIPKGFKFKQPDDIYDKLLIKGKKNYNPGEKIKVRAIRNYYDKELNKHINTQSDPWMVYEYRYEELINHPKGALVERIIEYE